jgi:hypothetical protein
MTTVKETIRTPWIDARDSGEHATCRHRNNSKANEHTSSVKSGMTLRGGNTVAATLHFDETVASDGSDVHSHEQSSLRHDTAQ